MKLTDLDKEKITELRNQNKGYGYIANQINVSRDQVRDYCRYHGLAGEKAEIKKVSRKSCIYCGKNITHADNWKSVTYCSDDCKEKNWQKKREQRKKERVLKEYRHVCVRCTKEFTNQYPTTKYCCDECKYETKVCVGCGGEFKVRISDKKKGRKYCSNKCQGNAIRKSHEEYCEQFTKIHKWKIVPITRYQGMSEDITVKCFECGKETTRKAVEFVEQSKRRGCQYCCKQLSTAENVIEDFLIDRGLGYIRQYQCEDLSHKGKLRFDFAIIDETGRPVKFIEYNGRQHYEPVEWFGGNDSLVDQKIRDSVKREYAKNIGVPLIEISHKQRNELNQILGAIPL